MKKLTTKQIKRKQSMRKAKRTAKKERKNNILGYIICSAFGLILAIMFYYAM